MTPIRRGRANRDCLESTVALTASILVDVTLLLASTGPYLTWPKEDPLAETRFFISLAVSLYAIDSTIQPPGKSTQELLSIYSQCYRHGSWTIPASARINGDS
jgi:hypothetical protein